MRRFLLLMGVVSALTSCVNLPGPRSPQDSLIIGSVALVFPEGLFGGPAWTIGDQVELGFRDVTTGTRFPVYTSGGRFWFTADGTHEFALEYSRASFRTGAGGYHLKERTIGLKIPAEPGRVLDLGRISLVYRAPAGPRPAQERYWDRDYEMSDAGTAAGGMSFPTTRVYRAYDVSVTQSWEGWSAADSLRRLDPRSGWLEREVVPVRM